MKTLVTLCAGIAAISLSSALFADQPIFAPNVSGSVINGSSYTISTGSDLIVGETAIAEAHGLYSTNTYNPGWTGQGGGPGSLTANNPAYDPTGDAMFLANLTDGSYGGYAGSQGNFASGGSSGADGSGDSGAGYTATYSLGSSPLGYQLTNIAVYSGWQDSGRYQQAYSIQFSLPSAPNVYYTLATVSPYPLVTGGNDGAMTELTPTSGEFLDGGLPMANIRITFNEVANGWTGYREFVANGLVAPEPSTYALLALGAGCLAFVVRRRQLANS